MKYYTGIGSRETPREILSLMAKIATKLELDGYILRSGGASGADIAFERGIADSKNKEIYIPWNGFNNNYTGIIGSNQKGALELASKVHPAWHRCSAGAKKLHTRNAFQVLGSDLNIPSKFIICWTKNGQEVGGTAIAIKMAKLNKVPVYNLWNKVTFDQLTKYVEK